MEYKIACKDITLQFLDDSICLVWIFVLCVPEITFVDVFFAYNNTVDCKPVQKSFFCFIFKES